MAIKVQQWIQNQNWKEGKDFKITKDVIVKRIKKNPRISLKKLGNKLNLKASTSTISRQLGKSDVHRRKLRKIPTLNARHKLERYNYALTYCNPKYDWSKWIWTDEKKFNLDGPDGYNYYWHTKGQPPLKYSSNASSKKSIMVWGGISKSGQTKLVKVNGLLDAKKYCELLEEGLLPLYDDGDIFEQDRASSHTSKVCKKWCINNNIDMV